MKRIFLGSGLALVMAIGFGAGYVYAKQPHMQAALSDLQSAREQLQMADANKGGHRLKAIDLINQAIQEVKSGIAYAKGN